MSEPTTTLHRNATPAEVPVIELIDAGKTYKSGSIEFEALCGIDLTIVSGEYVAISNLHLEASATTASDGAPINLQYSAGPWRIVNNDLGPWPSTLAAPNNAKAGGISGEGAGVVILGNDIHDIA